MAKIKICSETGCHNAQTTQGYCRLHYLKNWRHLKDESQKKAAKKLDRYVESVLKRHPERYLEVIKKDIRSKGFEKMIDETFGNSDEGHTTLFDSPNYEEEIEEILENLKIGRDF